MGTSQDRRKLGGKAYTRIGGRYFLASGRASSPASVCPPSSTVCRPASTSAAVPYSAPPETRQEVHRSAAPAAASAARPKRGNRCPEQGPTHTPVFCWGTSAAWQNGQTVSSGLT